MRLVPIALALLVACGPSAQQLRTQQVQNARMAASQRPGPRQAVDLADAVHSAFQAGDYKANPQALQSDVTLALATIDRAVVTAGVDAPTLIGWKGLLFTDTQRYKEGLAAFQESFQMAPNKMAGRNLVVIYGATNQPQMVGQVCAATVEVLRSDDEKLDLIAMCRQNMNAASPEGEMAWMSPQLVTWYQSENARRMQQQIDVQNAQAERDRYQQRVVRQTEQCASRCKEKGLECQNDCDRGDQACDNRCVDINHACLDRCESKAYEKLDQ
jgi:hypothetical protein